MHYFCIQVHYFCTRTQLIFGKSDIYPHVKNSTTHLTLVLSLPGGRSVKLADEPSTQLFFATFQHRAVGTGGEGAIAFPGLCRYLNPIPIRGSRLYPQHYQSSPPPPPDFWTFRRPCNRHKPYTRGVEQVIYIYLSRAECGPAHCEIFAFLTPSQKQLPIFK